MSQINTSSIAAARLNEDDCSAFVAIVGRPNVGKIFFAQYHDRSKVAIVSSKPQTTRTKIMGVLTKGKNQLVFLDTPGLHKPHNALGNYMVKSITDSVAGVDACLLVVEAGKPVSAADRDLIENLNPPNCRLCWLLIKLIVLQINLF